MSSTSQVTRGKPIDMLMRTGVARLELSPAGRDKSASTMTGTAHEAGCPDEDVPTTCSLCSPGFAARGITTVVVKLPSGWATVETSTECLGELERTILTLVPGLNPWPINRIT